ncbi:MAG: hypothetical protein LBL74_05575 [Bacteroidales bacterium]|jgi:hypothetical protein|nr:hypothetical protein [Bacteroidales bacterium]
MRKVAIITILSIIILGFASCKSLEQDVFIPDYQNTTLLPRLTTWFDQPSFENAYGANSYAVKPNDDLANPYGLVETPYGKGVHEVMESTKLYAGDKRIQDAMSIFITEVKNNITDPSTRRSGNIVIRIGDTYRKNNYKWSWLSGFTVGILNACGMPMCSNRTELEVIVEIYDLRNNLVAKFNERGSSKQYMACYWGYYQFERRAAALALEDGMMKIKELIERDAALIKAKLR